MKRRIIGIDVGKNGGIVVYDTENNRLLECIKMPPTPKDLLDFLSIYKENSVCYLERVNGMTGQSASASFVFGEGYGQLTMGLIACGIDSLWDSDSNSISTNLAKSFRITEYRQIE